MSRPPICTGMYFIQPPVLVVAMEVRIEVDTTVSWEDDPWPPRPASGNVSINTIGHWHRHRVKGYDTIHFEKEIWFRKGTYITLTDVLLMCQCRRPRVRRRMRRSSRCPCKGRRHPDSDHRDQWRELRRLGVLSVDTGWVQACRLRLADWKGDMLAVLCRRKGQGRPQDRASHVTFALRCILQPIHEQNPCRQYLRRSAITLRRLPYESR